MRKLLLFRSDYNRPWSDGIVGPSSPVLSGSPANRNLGRIRNDKSAASCGVTKRFAGDVTAPTSTGWAFTVKVLLLASWCACDTVGWRDCRHNYVAIRCPFGAAIRNTFRLGVRAS